MTIRRTPISPGSQAARMLLLAVVYFAAAMLGLRLAPPNTNASAIWIPAGLAVAATLRLGSGVWPAIFLGAFSANAYHLGMGGLALGPLLGISLATAAANAGEAVLAGYLIERVTGTRQPFDSGSQVLGFLVLGVGLSPALCALAGTTVFCAGTGHWDRFPEMGLAWWLGDAVGVLLLTPLFLTFSWAGLAALPRRTHREALGASVLLLAVWLGACNRVHALTYLVLPILVFSAFRLGTFYASCLVALLAAAATLATLSGTGPFVDGLSTQAALILQQGFLGTLAITTLALAAAVQERKTVEAQKRGAALKAQETKERLRETNRRVRVALENLNLLAVTLNADATIAYCNGYMLRLTGWTSEALVGRPWFETFLPEDQHLQAQEGFIRALQADEIPVHYENEILTRAGARRYIRWNNTNLRDGQGAIIGIVSLGEDITERKRAEALLAGQKQVLEMTAAGLPLEETLAALLKVIESQAPGMQGSILLLDEDGLHVRHGAAPSLPAAFVAAVDGQPIGPCAGSCGTAAYRKEAVHVEDIATDPLWATYRAAALPHGLRACWSTPIFSAARQVIGMFAMYYRQPGLPQAEHRQLIDIATHTAAIAITSHRARRELREREERFRGVFEQANDGIYLLSSEFRYLDANARGLELLGYTREELLQRHVADVLAPRERAQWAADPSQAMADAFPLAEWEHVRRDGSTFPGEVSARRLDDGSYLAILRDQTGRKHAEALLAQRAIQLEALNTLGTSMAASLDFQARARAALGSIMRAVAPDLALLFVREGEALRLVDSASGPRGLIHDETPAHRVGHCLCGLSAKEGRPRYSIDIHSDARCTWDECKKAGVKSFAVLPLKNGDEVLGVLGLASATERDFQQQSTFLETLAAQATTGLLNARLHEQVKAHAASLEARVEERTALLQVANANMARAVEQAQAADRAKSAFLSAMSHELRTPLNSVIGFTGVLLGGLAGELKAEQREPLEIVQRNGRHLLDLINDVLDLSKIEANEMRLNPGPFDLAQVAREALEAISPAARTKGLELACTLALDPCPVPGDRRRTAQILLNLLSNAVKFTTTGTVTLGLTAEKGRVLVAVRDTGSGIAENDLPRLFREFEQLDVGLGRRNEGTGLGLALSRRLARLMGGDITLESKLGHGSTFTLHLPLGNP